MKCLITGGSGQLGLALQNELGRRKIDYVAANSSELDITKPVIVSQQVDLIKPTIIINAGAWTNVDEAESNDEAAYAVNALGPQNLAIAAKQVGAKMVQVSTDYVFSGEQGRPWGESSEPNPQTVYGKTKSQGEKFLLDLYPHDSFVIRTAWLYSAYRTNFVKTMTKLALLSNSEVRVVNDQVGQPTFVGDLAKQITDLISSQATSGIYHATNSGQSTWFEFAQEIFKLVGADVSRVVPILTTEFPRPAKRPMYSVLGHESWAKTSVPAMRDWRIALAEAMPAIILAVKEEE